MDTDKMLSDDPFLRFSLYTAWRVQALIRKGEELNAISDGWKPDPVNQKRSFDNFPWYSENFWFWVLGAYEIIRTMSQHQECFAEHKREEIFLQKKKLAVIRMPFSKQEKAGQKGPIYAENSVHGLGKGLLYEIDGKAIDSYRVIKETLSFLNEFKAEDIVKRIPESQDNSGSHR